MPEPCFNSREEYERRKAGQGARGVVRVIGWVWFVLAGLIVGVLVILRPPRPDLANVVMALLILGGPGLLLVGFADQDKQMRSVALLLLPISIVFFLGYGCFVLL